MPTQTLTRTVTVTHTRTYPTVTFRRWIGERECFHVYTLECVKMKDRQLRRIDRLSFKAAKTTCMVFNDGIFVTCSFWKEVER